MFTINSLLSMPCRTEALTKMLPENYFLYLRENKIICTLFRSTDYHFLLPYMAPDIHDSTLSCVTFYTVTISA